PIAIGRFTPTGDIVYWPGVYGELAGEGADYLYASSFPYGTWKLHHVLMPADAMPQPTRGPILAPFEPGRISGHDGCNEFSLRDILIQGNELTVSGYESTMIGCPRDEVRDYMLYVLDSESVKWAATVNTLPTADQRLNLWSEETGLNLVFVPESVDEIDF